MVELKIINKKITKKLTEKMKKKSFLKTIEILLVILITTILSISIIQNNDKSISFNKNQDFYKNYLIILEKNPEFRNFVLKNSGCFNLTNINISNKLDFYFYNNNVIICIDSFPNIKKNLYSESIFLLEI
ncbi:MAG: hypothetical protein QXM96_01320 [Candidatus Woesearchaeota archaeon]